MLVFIHGYNTTFDYAIRKTAQLAADLEFVTCEGEARGVSVAYSWPARDTVLGYAADEENAEWTQQRLAPFLKALSSVCREENAELHLIAHSMGARALIRSLAGLAQACPEKPHGYLANQVVLLAPDIEKALFDQYAERMLPLIQHLTIYVSAKDRALALSSFLHGGHHRLGLIESTLLTALQLTGIAPDDHRELGYAAEETAGEKFDMIDVSAGLADPFGHSYEDPKFIQDLRELIYHNTPAGTGGRSNLEPRTVRPLVFGIVGKKLRYFRLKAR